MAKKRITELATETTLKDGQYVAIDHTTDGTKKLNLGAELTDLKEDFEALETQLDETTALALAALPQETIENVAIASFDDGGDGVPVKELKVSIEPIQSGSGDPSPTNVRPISGRDSVTVTRTGVNLFNPNSYEELDLNGAGAIRYGHEYKQSGTYGIVNTTPNEIYYRVPTKDLSSRGSSVTVASGHSTTVTIDSTHMLWVFVSGDWSVASPNLVCVTLDGSITYEPYQGQSYPISLSSTIYGGTLEVETGVLTVDRAHITIDETSNISPWATPESPWFGFSYNPVIQVDPARSTIVCDTINSNLDSALITSWNCYTVSGTLYFCINETALSERSINAVKVWLASNPLHVVCKVTNPTTVQLTPAQVTTLLKDNNIFADSGNIVKLIYRADLGAYIEKLINA